MQAGDAMNDAQIIARWVDSSAPWTLAVREGRIASRLQVTNAAMVEAVRARSPRSVFDIGCGEGWLARALAAHGIDVRGIDAVPALVESARQAGAGRFSTMSYEALADHGIDERFDVCVCNFSLLGERATNRLIDAIPTMLNPGGALIVQTLHPWLACGDAAYSDGWREGSWRGIEGDFGEPAPWYFRTLQGWMQLFACAGLRIDALHEPSDPQASLPLSLILIGIDAR